MNDLKQNLELAVQIVTVLGINISNGLLLRSDLHALFDANLLAIEPVTHLVYLAPAVEREAEYSKLNGHKISLPNESTHRPNFEALKRRWAKFKAAHH